MTELNDAKLDIVLLKSVEPFQQAQKRLWFVIGSCGLLGIAIVAILGSGIAELIARRIRSLTDATDKLASGDFATRLPIIRNDEIGVLAGGFNFMAEQVQGRDLHINAQVEQLQFTLEELQETKDRNLVFEIEDTGAGIAPEEFDQLFAAFGQTTAGRQSEQGTGLGLPISQKFVQLMGGEIAVSSQLDRGSIFSFSIAIELAETADNDRTQPERQIVGLEPDQPNDRILVVDDRTESRILLVQILTPLGFEVRQAANGIEALEIWSTWSPHLIWMDMRMPVMDGYEATKRIKSHLKGQATVVVALTASALQQV